MIALLSPARGIRSVQMQGLPVTLPAYLPQTIYLADQLKQYSPWQLESLLCVNPTLAMNAFEAFQSFDPTQSGSPAALAYWGIAYQNLDAQQFSLDDFAFAQHHLRIASAFYGLLRPADGILPYRLELQCKVRIDRKNLYAFWGDQLYRDLFCMGQPVINLMSAEYAKLFRPYLTPNDRLITCDFLVYRRGKWVTLPTAAKTARGQMAQYILRNRLDAPEQLQSFDFGGYEFAPHLSTDIRYCFQSPLG